MRFTALLPLFAFSTFIAATPARAAEDTPNSIPGGTHISVDQAKSLHDKGALFVDARVAAEYAEKHIKGRGQHSLQGNLSKSVQDRCGGQV
jgi:hypothetical protein